jgi:hypothetical protein
MPVVSRPAAIAVLLGAIAGVPRVAAACAVCMAGYNDETRQAFLASTAFMSLLPLLLIGGLVWWLRRRARSGREGMRAPGARPTGEAATRTSSVP